MKQKTLNCIVIRIVCASVMFFVLPGFVSAATGDMLYQNCTTGTCTGSGGGASGSGDGWISTVETNGCHTTNCVKLVGVVNPNYSDDTHYGGGTTGFDAPNVIGHDEITVSVWVKFDEKATSISGGNMKLTRAYVGGSNLWASDLIPNNASGDEWYSTHMVGTLRPASWFKLKTHDINAAFPYDNGDGTYYAEWGTIGGNIVSGGPTPPGTTWMKVTKWIKLPSTSTSTDGAMKLWYGDELALELWNAKFHYSSSVPYITQFVFQCSSEAREPFEHWMDDMVVYEGYVPPVSDSGPTLLNPQPISALSVGTTSTTMSVSTDVASTCKYSTTPGTSYASMSNTMTGGGTTSHSALISGLTNGSSTTYYLRCAKTSDGEATSTDFPITISVLNTQHSLTATKNGTGNGTLTSSPSGINCGSTCSYNFNENSSVIVTATPDSNSIFASWSGCTSTNGNQCTVTMNTAKNITATFNNDAAVCDADHYWACTDGPCQTQGFHFWEGACRTIPVPTDWTGTNIATNGNFTSWTNNFPDSWSSYTTSNISEDTGACNIGANGHIYLPLPEIKTYRYVINIRNMTDLLETWTDNEGSFYHYAIDGSSRTVTGLISYDGEGDQNVYFGQGSSNIVVDDIVIKEISNTAAFRFDVDGSSEITTNDALLTLRNSLGLTMDGTPWQASATTGDVNCDGSSGSTDALLILRYSLGLGMSETGWCEGS